jgi:hypothetical protein
MKRSNYSRILQGASCKNSFFILGTEQRAGGHPAGGSSGLRRRRLERLGVRAPREKGRGERGDQDGVLTSGGEGRGAARTAGRRQRRLRAGGGALRAGAGRRRQRWSCSFALWTSLRRRPGPDASLGGEPKRWRRAARTSAARTVRRRRKAAHGAGAREGAQGGAVK